MSPTTLTLKSSTDVVSISTCLVEAKDVDEFDQDVDKFVKDVDRFVKDIGKFIKDVGKSIQGFEVSNGEGQVSIRLFRKG